jgi:hypothetical protein
MRIRGWSPDPQIQKSIKEKLLTNTRLAGAVDRAREFIRKKEEEATTAKNKSREGEDKSEGNSDEKSSTSTRGVFAVRKAISVESYTCKLKNCWTLDSATFIHVCNDRSRFKFDRTALENDIIVTGKTTHAIEAFGSIDISVETPNGLPQCAS